MKCGIEINKDFKGKFVKGLDNEKYHQDKTKLNSSLLRYMFKSPRAFLMHYLGQFEKEPTDKMKLGTIFHMAALEGQKFLDRYVVEPEFTGFTKEGKLSKQSGEAKSKKAAWHIEMKSLGKEIITQKDYDTLRWMIDSFIKHNDAITLIKNGIPELTGYAADEETGIVQRIRPDFLSFDARILVEAKTCNNAEYDYFSRRRIESPDFRYDLQIAMYSHVIELITGKPVENNMFIVTENVEPYETAVYEMSLGFLEAAKDDYKIILRKLEKCIKDNNFPSMQTETQWMFPTDWYVNKERKEL